MEGMNETYVLRFTFHVSRFTFHVLFTVQLICMASSFAGERIIDYVIAVVNDQPIARSELENELIIREIENPSDQVKRAVLENLIERKLMLQKADDIGIPLALRQEKVNAEIEAIKSTYPSEALFFEELKESGLEYQELEEWLRNDLIMKELIARQFRSAINDAQIDQEAAQYFEQNRLAFVEPMQIRFQYIMVLSNPGDAADQRAEAKQLAEVIFCHLKAGREFREVQQTYSDNPFLLVVQEPQTHIANTEVGLAIAELEIDEVSQPFLTPDGYLIARLLGKKLLRQKTYPEVSQEIKEQLLRKKLEQEVQAWLDEQKEVGDIRILDAKLAQTQLEDTRSGDEQ